MERFLNRLRIDLLTNNTLRGSWVEEIVACFLRIETFPGQWNYYDLRDPDGHTISVKQSVGHKARFDVSGRRNAWDNDLAARLRETDPKAGGWIKSPDGLPRRWCDVYVFAHLPEPVVADRVVDVDAWRFAGCSSAWLDAHVPKAKSLSVRQLHEQRVRFVRGDDLRDEVSNALAEAEATD